MEKEKALPDALFPPCLLPQLEVPFLKILFSSVPIPSELCPDPRPELQACLSPLPIYCPSPPKNQVQPISLGKWLKEKK